MNRLIFIYISYRTEIFWIIQDSERNKVKQGQCRSLSELPKENIEYIQGILISPDIMTKTLEVPPSKKSEITQSLPFLLEDNLLGNLYNYHLVTSDRDHEGMVKASLIPKNLLEDLNKEFQHSNLETNSLVSIDNCLNIEEYECLLVLLDNFSIVYFGNQWGWCAETETILNLLNKGIKEFQCKSLRIFTSDSKLKINWKDYVDVKPSVEQIDNEYDFFMKVIDIFSPETNLLTDKFAPRIPIERLFVAWRDIFSSIAIVIILYFSQIFVNIFQNISASIKLEDASKNLYYSAYPNKSKNIDLKKVLQNRIKNLPLSKTEPFMETLSNVSEVIVNNQRASLYSVTFDNDRGQFMLEVQCLQFDDLEALQNTFIQSGYEVELGASKRVGNSVLSEIYLKKS